MLRHTEIIRLIPCNAIAMQISEAMGIHLAVLSGWTEWHFSSLSIKMTLIVDMSELMYMEDRS